MLAALIVVDLHVPGASSLKERRGPVSSLVRRLRHDLDVSVAEIGEQDLWQRATLGVAVAASSEVGARKVAQSVEKLCFRDPRLDVIEFHVEVVETER